MSRGQEITPEPEEPDDAVTLCREVFDEASEPSDKGGDTVYYLFHGITLFIMTRG